MHKNPAQQSFRNVCLLLIILIVSYHQEICLHMHCNSACINSVSKKKIIVSLGSIALSQFSEVLNHSRSVCCWNFFWPNRQIGRIGRRQPWKCKTLIKKVLRNSEILIKKRKLFVILTILIEFFFQSQKINGLVKNPRTI